MLIKVCGMRDPANIAEVERLGIDLMGFIFYEKSSRYVSQVPRYLPTRCARVGVFVNAPVSEIVSAVSIYGLDYIQLHGDESQEFVRSLRKESGDRVKLIKAVRVRCPEDAAAASLWEGLADMLLFETASTSYGGSGHIFDWNMLNCYQGSTPFLIAGGIGPESASQIKAFRHPSFLGVDLNSRFETAPGIKDADKLKNFITHL